MIQRHVVMRVIIILECLGRVRELTLRLGAPIALLRTHTIVMTMPLYMKNKDIPTVKGPPTLSSCYSIHCLE